ncbi:MAG: S-layer homology domain-containing protein [Oscillospiraceae bacterium]|nr:S-layer homology domain-containing protein [Oscillospiraceae bacterium]
MGKILSRVISAVLVIVVAVVPLVVGARPLPPDTPMPDVILGPVRAPVQSAATDSGMEVALVAVHRLLDIDDDVLPEFSYSSTFSNWETREGLTWSFTWSGENAMAWATATPHGALLLFNSFEFDSNSFGFAEISKDDAIERASAFLRRANPSIHQYFGAPQSARVSLHGSEFNFVFHAEVNSHAFIAAQINVGVNKFTGAITSYSTQNVDPTRFRFESADDVITQESAAYAFAEGIGLTLEYRSNFDRNGSQVTVFPVYVMNTQGSLFVSALTGEVVEQVFDVGLDAGGLGMVAAAPEAARELDDAWEEQVTLSPAERAAIEQVEGFITSEQALGKLLEVVELADLDLTVFSNQHISLNRDFMDADRFIYNVSLSRNLDWDAPEDEIRSIFGTVDAETGRVRSFDISYNGVPFSADGRELSHEQAQATADAFLERMAPDELARTQSGRDGPPTIVPIITGFGFGNTSHFNYTRFENGIPFHDNRIGVTVNRVTGRITSFSLNWFDNVEFPSIANVLTPHEAMANFVGREGSDIIYITTGEGNARLVFDFVNSLIDPFTGVAVDHSGNPREDKAESPEYGDVVGHWSEAYVMRLLENGVYGWGGSFEPDRVMNEVEFVAYIMQIEQPWMARMGPQAFLSQRGISVELSENRQVTRQVAARIIVEHLGYGRIAGQPRWFAYPFNDSVGDAFKGFVTVAYMLDIISGDADGNFNAMGNVTRGQAAAMLHNLILAQTAALP